MGGPKAEGLADVRAILDRAIEAEKGLRLTFGTKKALGMFRFRCYAARKRDREQAVKAYDYGDPRRGKSPYDSLMFIADTSEDNYVLTILKLTPVSVEEIE